jgi:hypothetical protein
LEWNPNNTAAPNVRVGSWVLDATPVPGPGPGTFLPPHATFYRVVGVTEGIDTTTNPNQPTLTLELQTPLRNFTPNTPGQAGVLIVTEGVAEVFEKRTGWHP